MIASIIIPNYNGRRWLEIALPSLVNQVFDEAFEIIIVDNNSSDDSVDYIKRYFPEVKTVRLGKNFGYAGGCNEGLKHAKGEFIIILNSDVEVDPKWLYELVEAARKNKEYQILCSKDQYAVKRDFSSYLEVVRVSHGDKPKKGIVSSLFATGACFLVRKDWIAKLGYLFEPWFYFEDAELSLRTIFLGGNIGYVMNSRFHHYAGRERSIRSTEEHKQKMLVLSRFSARNKIRTMFARFSLQAFVKLLVVHSSYVMLSCLKKRGEQRKNIAMIQGSIEGVCELGKTIKSHRVFQKKKKRSDHFILRKLLYRQGSLTQRSFYTFLNS